MFVNTWIRGIQNIYNITKVNKYFAGILDCPTHKIHQIKCLTTINDHSFLYLLLVSNWPSNSTSNSCRLTQPLWSASVWTVTIVTMSSTVWPWLLTLETEQRSMVYITTVLIRFKPLIFNHSWNIRGWHPPPPCVLCTAFVWPCVLRTALFLLCVLRTV